MAKKKEAVPPTLVGVGLPDYGVIPVTFMDNSKYVVLYMLGTHRTDVSDIGGGEWVRTGVDYALAR